MHAQSYPTLWDTMDYSPKGSSVHGIFQASILEWLSCTPPGHLPDLCPVSPALQVDSLLMNLLGSPWEGQ